MATSIVSWSGNIYTFWYEPNDDSDLVAINCQVNAETPIQVLCGSEAYPAFAAYERPDGMLCISVKTTGSTTVTNYESTNRGASWAIATTLL
jgi:hypothetical protein